MKEQTLNIRYMVAQLSELSQQEQELVNRAKAATSNAYANYSHFYVGAALLLGDGRIVIGANQENAAFPSGLLTLAIAARNGNGFLKSPISPCGACRQVILEMEDRYQRPVRILLYGENGIYCFDSIKDLLPFCFVDSNMKE
jgi:cytidine deaminase